MKKSLPLVGILLAGHFFFQGAIIAADADPLVVSSGQQVIDAKTISGISGISVSKGATAVIDFGQSSVLHVSGNINNAGSIFAVSSNPAVHTASLSGLNITNGSGALLTTVLPTGGFAGMGNLVQNLNLSLSAVNNIVNMGTISSAANLSMAAGNSIINSSVINASQHINMITGVAGLVNSGTIASIAGNINISNLASQNVFVNNTNGTLQALLGSVNLASVVSSALDKLNISLIGGDILSKELNITNPKGIATLDVSSLTGVLNATSGEIHVSSQTSNLQLGSLNITGDPLFFNTGNIQINGNLSFAGQNLALIASGDITTSGAQAWNITTSSAGNGGNILMVAGVAITSPGSGGSGTTGGGPYSTGAVTISSVGATGGNIDLTSASGPGIASLDSSSTNNGSGGNITLIAYGGGGKGSVLLPNNVTIKTGTALSNNFTLNGDVTIIAGANTGTAVSVGNINASGNSANPSINNGLVNIFASAPAMYQSVNQQDAPSSFTTLNGNQLATQTYLIVSDATNITNGQTLYLNPNGANPEVVSVSSAPSGTTIPISTQLQANHGSGEYVMTSVSSLTVPQNAVSPSSQVIQNGKQFGPSFANGQVALQGGNISVGSISSGANVIIGTNTAAAAGSGVVNLGGAITLSQNPITAPSSPLQNFNDTPVVQITGQQVNVPSGTTISSTIAGCSFCQDQLNIYTPNLTNAGTISGSSVNISNPAASTVNTLTVNNTGSITGVNPGSVAGNPWVNIQSAGGIVFTSSAPATSGISVPNWGVISVNAADNNGITFNNTTNFTAGVGGLVSFSAQGAGGSVTISPNSALVASAALQGFGGPVLSVSSPTINFGNGSSIQGVQSNMVFTSGALTQSPQALTMSVASGGSAQIFSGSNNTMVLRPTDGQNISFTSPGTGASLAFSGGTVNLFTGTNRSTNVAGQILFTPSVIKVTATSSQSAVDPNGGITGIAFQPYVGPAINFNANPKVFTSFSTYTYPQVLLLMAPIASTGLFQNLGTYSQGAFLGPGNPSASLQSSYVINGAARYTIQAAKQMGFTVSAGAYSNNPDFTVNVPPTQAEIAYAVQQATTYGNVADMVVGNECIIADGTGSITSSVNSLVTAINYAQTQRTANGFNATTLPVTTRQTYGALSGVNSATPNLQTNTLNLLNGCAGCYGIANYTGVDGHVYADVYPYYDGTSASGTVVANSVIGYLVPGAINAGSITSISSSNFQTLVTAAGNLTPSPTPPPAPPPVVVGIQADLNGTIQAFITRNVNAKLWVAETGWATASTQSTNTQTSTPPNNAPQANPTWAGYYYPDMQSWSYTNNAGAANNNYKVAVINGYFESYDEPWKFNATNWQGGEPNFGVWTATGTNQTSSVPTPVAQYQLTGISQKYNLPIYNLTASPLPTPPSSPSLLSPAPSAPPLIASLSSVLPIVNLSSTLQLASANTGGTIAPTDVNPQVQTASDVGSTNPNASGNSAGLPGGGSNPTLAGNVLYSQPQFGLNPNDSVVSFTGTNALLAPDHDLTVNTNLANIQLDAGAAVMMIQTGGQLAIYALHDDHSGAVRVSVGEQTMEIPVGRQLILSSDQSSKFDSLNPSSIGYRNVVDGKMGPLKAYTAEFSLPTALSTTQAIRHLMKSADKEERDLARKLLKTAAAMVMVSKDKQPFKSSH